MSEGTTAPAAHACMDCGKPLKLARSIRCKGCSLRHTARSKPDRVERYCKTCGGEIGGSNRLKAIYCSKGCKFADPELRSKLGSKPNAVTKNCPQCGKDFTVSVSMAGRYTRCSLACLREATKDLGSDVECARCGKTFRRLRGVTRSHCSEGCRRPPVYIICEKCGTEFRATPSDAKTRRYCSSSCYRASDAETTIERLVREVLDREMVRYQQQHKIGRWSVDFLLGARLVIEADGDYWHAMRPDVDRRKDADLASRGYEVWRLPEADITSTGFPARLASRLTNYQKAEGPLPAADLLQILRPARKLTIGAKRVHGPLGRPRGEAHLRAKLTEAEVIEIRASSEPLAKLGARYGMGLSQISRIRKGQSWTHVDAPVVWVPRQADASIIPLQRSGPLTASETEAIRTSTAMGVDLARLYGVSQPTISAIRRGHQRRSIHP